MNYKGFKYIIAISLTLSIIVLPIFNNISAQSKNERLIRSGNRDFNKNNYNDAALKYRQALGMDASSVKGNYNLGVALYKMGLHDEAYDHFSVILDADADSLTKSKIYYNFGNASLKRYLTDDIDKKYHIERERFLSESIEAYSQALRYDPEDDDARYNLAYALKLKQDADPFDSDMKNEQQVDQEQFQQPEPEVSIKEEMRMQPDMPEKMDIISRELAERMLNAIREKEIKTAEQINRRERARRGTDDPFDW